MLSRAETRMVSPENPTGEKGKGGMAVPNLADSSAPAFSQKAAASSARAGRSGPS